jgi:hypothetical protein
MKIGSFEWRCKGYVNQWFHEQYVDPFGPTNVELYERVKKALADLYTPSQHFVSLLREIRGNTSGWTAAGAPPEFQHEFQISATTWRRWIKEGKLIVERISRKTVRVRMDHYLKYRKNILK